MILLHNATQLVTPRADQGYNLTVIENGAMAIDGGKIMFAGTTTEALKQFSGAQKIDLSGKVLLPGFVDSHTHLAFAGNRNNEFLMRLRGATYQEIAAAGGGILSTVNATSVATEEELIRSAQQHLDTMIQFGTTTVEAKTGYGLSWEMEEKLLRVYREIKLRTPVDLICTFLGAHDFPRNKDRSSYMNELLDVMLPEVARHRYADFSDVFCDQGYYTVEQARTLSLRAAELGLKVKLHVDELADVGGAALAAEVRAVSADHLIYANDEGIRKMAEANVCAVLLPGTSFSLKMKQHAPARKMIESGVRVAIATDFNPGTCYCHSMLQILQLSTLLYSLSAEEAIVAATLNGAAAIDKESEIGSLEPGKQADCLIFDIPHYGYLFYNLGVNQLETVIKKGKILWSKNQSS